MTSTQRRVSILRNRYARIAGLLYLIAIAGGFFVLDYIPEKLIKSGDAAATAHNILANERLLQIGIVGELTLGVITLCVALALFRLLEDVDRVQASLMVILGGFMQVPLYFVAVVNYVAALLLVDGATFLMTFSTGQRYALAMLFLRLHHYEIQASLVFAGLWLLPLGALVYKSRFLPRTIGVWLELSGITWLVVCVTGFLAPQYSERVYTLAQPLLLGELALTLWLVIMGARVITRPRSRTTV